MKANITTNASPATTGRKAALLLAIKSGNVISHPYPGETKWDKEAPSREMTSKLAHEHWDVSALQGPDEAGVYTVVTCGGYAANIGNIGGQIAILNRETDGGRTLIQSAPRVDLSALPKTLPGTSGVKRATHCPQPKAGA